MILSPDLIYGGFCVGAFFITLLSVKKAIRTRSAGGVSIWTPLYFALWSAGNIIVFSPTAAPISFWGNLLLLTANIAYVTIVYLNEQYEKVSQNKLLP